MDKRLEQFEKAVILFDASDRGPKALLEFSIQVWCCTKQGSGINFTQVEDVIKRFYSETKGL